METLHLILTVSMIILIAVLVFLSIKSTREIHTTRKNIFLDGKRYTDIKCNESKKNK